MLGQTLFFRACGSTNAKLIFTNRIKHVNIKTPCMELKNDAKSLINDHQIPEKPKRPLTAYFKFLVERRPIVHKENPSLHIKDLVRVISEQWKLLSTTDKAKYEEEAMQEKGKYNEDILNYNAQLTPEQAKVLQKIEQNKRQDRKKRKMKKEFKAMGKPKKPLSSFGLFIQENASSGKPLTKLISEMQQKWMDMSESEKQKYQVIYQKNKEKYDVELAKWEENMIAEGKSHLVRVKTLKGNSSQKKHESK